MTFVSEQSNLSLAAVKGEPAEDCLNLDFHD